MGERMLVGTWNVGGNAPSEGMNLRDWLRKQQVLADIYVLGFQEIVPLSAGNILASEDKSQAARWLSLIDQELNENALNTPQRRQYHNNKAKLSPRVSPVNNHEYSVSSEEELDTFFGSSTPSSSNLHHEQYCLVTKKQMVGIFLCVFIRKDLHHHISRLKVSCVGTGIMGYLGNKGSVSISMMLHNSTFCFVCTHLASGEKVGDKIRRNNDVNEILEKTRFGAWGKEMHRKTIMDHDMIVWLGDLNYRLTSGCDNTHELLRKNDWQALLGRDQLRIERSTRRLFQGWEEGIICFAPTYKYLKNSDEYVIHASTSQKKRRMPAWCDRILWRGEGLKQMFYLRGESKFSDHKPVYSLFLAHVNSVNE